MSTKRMEQLLQFLASKPKDSFLCFAVAKEYEKQENWDQALAYYLKIIEHDPNYVGTYYHLGKLYERLAEPEKAFAAYKSGMPIAKAAGDRQAYNELAGAKLNLGDEEDFE